MVIENDVKQHPMFLYLNVIAGVLHLAKKQKIFYLNTLSTFIFLLLLISKSPSSSVIKVFFSIYYLNYANGSSLVSNLVFFFYQS